MKKNNMFTIVLGVWALIICLLIGKFIYDDIKTINDNKNSPYIETVEDSFDFNAVVGFAIDTNDYKVEENKDKKEISTKKVNENNTKVTYSISDNENDKQDDNIENILLKEIYGTKIYKQITYTYKNGEKAKISEKEIVDASNYHATLNELKSDAQELMKENEDIYKEITKYTNEYRSNLSIQSLTLDDNLSLVATIRALEMAYSDIFSHTRPDGSKVTKLASDLNISYSTFGENIAYGFKNAQSVTNGWHNSKGHYENMVNDKYHKIGIGVFKFNNNIYWVQVFSN